MGNPVPRSISPSSWPLCVHIKRKQFTISLCFCSITQFRIDTDGLSIVDSSKSSRGLVFLLATTEQSLDKEREKKKKGFFLLSNALVRTDWVIRFEF